MLFQTMNKTLMCINEMTGAVKNFSRTITYNEANPEDKKEIIFEIKETPITFKEVYTIISDRTAFSQFVANIKEVVKVFEEEMHDRVNLKTLTEITAFELDTYFEEIKSFSEEFGTYKLSQDEHSASGTAGIWFTMCSSIPDILFSDESLNAKENTHDTKALLESNACIIISINNEQVMSILFNYYCEYLSARASKVDLHPVTIILEEANRLLSTGVDIDLERTITYSRQAKLSIVTVFQAWGQAYNAFGEHTASSILENVTRLTMIKPDNKNNKHMCYLVNEDGDKVYSFDPKFATQKELYAAEL
jgi:hypothetical protein